MEHIFSSIKKKQATFSKAFKRVSTYVFNDPKIFAIHSAAQAGRRMGVSETTVIRFSHALGYSGYKALQEDVQFNLFQKSSLSDYAETKRSENNHSIKAMMHNDMDNILKLTEQIADQDLEETVTRIANADRLLISGVRSSHALASWFSFALDLVVGNTRFYQPNVDDVLLRISELTKRSVFVAFSFHRYAVETVHIAKLAQQQGAFVIAFTDSPFAPITEFSDLTLAVQLNVKSTLDAAPVVFSLMNSIVSTISLRNSEAFQERVERFDSIEAQDFFP
ncbi:MurR/RpiR family transcriptional regulator [Virgibacillus byunsanensis]|uniref:MurR/RpiR family transcriptional regulator n=1 Tax=Virgibacillus byunsanensis TaxID=570945 RepID=A0ABW3LSB0_9BACI